MVTQRRSPIRRREPRAYRWADLDDERLLDMRLRNLRLSLAGGLVQGEIDTLYGELERRGIDFKPHVWISEEWFSPDGVPGIAVPFFVVHPRLRQLERRMMGDVDGGDSFWRLRLLRHEAGHALDTAYGLRKRADWRAVFGPASARYPGTYMPEPSSRRHVLHVGHWYAQSHPTEDFAETFAVWLQPKARWRREYVEWPALAKLEFVNTLMDEVAASPPRVRNREVIEPLSQCDVTLREHYRRKKARYNRIERRYDPWLTRVFTTRPARPRAIEAVRFIREIEQQVRRLLHRRDRLHSYLVDFAIATIARRAGELDLVLRGSRRDSKRHVVRLHERVVLDVLRRNREKYTL
jgi:hypothetical protein